MAKKANNRKKRQAERAQEAGPAPMSRRRLLTYGGIGVLGLGGTAAAGLAGVRAYGRYMREHDLTQIGNGKPAVVQVHDPACPTCTALQRQTRRAMRAFGECDLLYLIADINLPEGQVFAQRHNVANVTLVLMDGQGEAVEVLSGLRQRAELEQFFFAHVARYGV